MDIWTTFSPRKVAWELTEIMTKGINPTSDWQKQTLLIKDSLKTLKKAGIKGIRLVIFPSELTDDGKKFNFQPIDTMLDTCSDVGLLVTLCIGPFQYPYYPGIYIPQKLLNHIFDNDNALDTNPTLSKYGLQFLELQIERYGNDRRVFGFQIANEWPDKQNIESIEKLKKAVSEDFMTHSVSLLKRETEKPIFINTNIDASDKNKLTTIYKDLLEGLGKQGKMGFDVYPSQETWRNVPLQKIKRLIEPYHKSFRFMRKKFRRHEMYFAEVEAQPWGNGQSWFELINQEPNPNEKVLNYTRDSLKKTWKNHIKSTGCKNIGLWGSDFWLSSNNMEINWPLEEVKKLT